MKRFLVRYRWVHDRPDEPDNYFQEAEGFPHDFLGGETQVPEEATELDKCRADAVLKEHLGSDAFENVRAEGVPW